MTPNEKSIVKALVVIAWADGEVVSPEAGLIEGLLWAFNATETEEAEIKEFAQTKRTLRDLTVGQLERADRELLLAHAALLTHADGEQTRDEQKTLVQLARTLGFTDEETRPIIGSARDRAKRFASRL